MSKVAEILKSVESLDSRQKTKFIAALQSLNGKAQTNGKPASNNTPGIIKTPDVCSGVARFVRTRIPVWIVVRFRQLGGTDKEILDSYPTLAPSDLSQAWLYAAAHRDEIEKCIRDNEEL